MMGDEDKDVNAAPTKPDYLADLAEWTPEQQIQQIKLRLPTPVCMGSDLSLSYTPRPSDVIVAVPPKSGTTWLTHICHQIRMQGAEPDFEEQTDVIPFLEMAQTWWFDVNPETMVQPAEPRLFHSHLPYCQVPKGGKLIYCFRDQKDAVYSRHAFLNTALSFRGRVTLPVLAATMVTAGIIKALLHDLLDWWKHRNDKDVLLLFFDDLKEDHARCVHRIAKFIGVECDEAVLARVVHTTSHSEMARHHSKFDGHRLTARIARELGEKPPTEFVGKVRKDGGKSGDGRNLPSDVQQHIDEQWREIVTATLGFQDLNEMREAWRKEQVQIA